MSNYQGVGGAFLYARDPAALAAWYAEFLDLPIDPTGTAPWVELPGAGRHRDGRRQTTTFAIFAADAPLPEQAGARLNHRVRDLDAVLAKLTAAGIPFEGPQDEYGRFAWCHDPEGHRVEIWEPPAADPLDGPVAVVPWGKRFATDGTRLSERTIAVSTTVAAPIDAIWAAWTTSEGLTSWLCPDAEVDLRIGGPFEVRFLPDAPEGQRGSDDCVVLSFLPPRLLVFSWNAPPPHEQTRPQHTWVVLELTETDAGTTVSLTHTGWPDTVDAAPWQETFAYFDAAWRRVLANLEDHVW
jgi:uncharacterized protein YndB with AHSA1/START domain/catechol 2,3-dioxygenase-like lactoylglutathione lyase family enzyme